MNVLCRPSFVAQAQVARASFPLGSLTKAQVRLLASDAGLPTASRRDSQGVCFLGKLKWNDFLKHYIPDR